MVDFKSEQSEKIHVYRTTNYTEFCLISSRNFFEKARLPALFSFLEFLCLL